ncbi:hypothetical protein HB4184_03335 [Pseudomonas putida]|nr:hypothetical protein HB4184_03335 [Pseudomonas putida]
MIIVSLIHRHKFLSLLKILKRIATCKTSFANMVVVLKLIKLGERLQQWEKRNFLDRQFADWTSVVNHDNLPPSEFARREPAQWFNWRKSLATKNSLHKNFFKNFRVCEKHTLSHFPNNYL